MLDHVTATRYVTPLREGGSLPGLMEADDLGTYVVKYRGAGQGPRALVAEVVSGGLARALGLPVPDLVTVDVDPSLALGEPDQEVQDLLRASPGLNLGIDFLPGALDFDPVAFPVDPAVAGRVLWFDALVGNVDRSFRNPNMLFWGDRAWLIDHGATLAFHHRWDSAASFDAREYDASSHVLRGSDPDLRSADAELGPRVTPELLRSVVAAAPAPWLLDAPGAGEADADGAAAADADADAEVARLRDAYVERIAARLSARGSWLPPLVDAVARRAEPGR